MKYSEFAQYYKKNISRPNGRHFALSFALYSVIAISFIIDYFVPGIIILLFPFIIVPFLFTIHLANVRAMMDSNFKRGLYRNFLAGYQEKIFHTYQPIGTLLRGILAFFVSLFVESIILSLISPLFPAVQSFMTDLESIIQTSGFASASAYLNTNWNVIRPLAMVLYLIAFLVTTIYIIIRTLIRGFFINYALGLTVLSSSQVKMEIASPYATFKKIHYAILFRELLLPFLTFIIFFAGGALLSYFRFPDDLKLAFTLGMIFGLLPSVFFIYRLYTVSDVLYDIFFRNNANYFLNVITRDANSLLSRLDIDGEMKKKIEIYLITLKTQVGLSLKKEDSNTSKE